jgi:UDP-glucose 4-epimerase
MSKVLVTGGAGFIGSHVVEALLDEGHKVTVIDNLTTGKLENLDSRAKFIEADICDPLLWHLIGHHTPHKFEYVFHLAALARIQPSIIDPIQANEVNLNGTLNVLQFCRQTNAKIVFSGSSSIYEGITFPTREDDPKKPKSPYAMQKLMCEQYIRLFRELYGISYAVLRYFNVYGERQILDGAYAAVVGILLKQKEKGLSLTITSDGEQMRDFTYVKDVAHANVMAMDWQGTFNIGTGQSYSINELADRIGGDKQYVGEREGEARMTRADNSKAAAVGWFPTKDIMDWIDENNR